ncbi:MAG: hypothetical protein JO097_21690 [Acidobacteriaceae bacterium]|nr:hypothetical protein [Acidobacteriaceae bacterium]MBV9297190.1 hypothetical protein [Acidobacteriaceae bacterium]MBV9765296.1 hypothetical protein [Acidobacteriaceae bacterium]
MEVPLSPEKQTQLAQLAAHRGQAADTLAAEVISHYLEQETRFVAAVNLGEAELERGEYLTSEQVGEQLERLFRS